ncbi:hypothetical protein Y1Q_0006469 [Alligator mississippiensis]|uniref:MROH2B-like HEAT-repeats domain-containing protein n=1 Tax=Alligator mississippiensis TaxID=8496 RepID=A0A151MVI5_ALLMI|nr:hypothetical protein Y1Q_0006469 [Alligator mississippiensis]
MRLQQEEETRVTVYSSLEKVLQGDTKDLDRSLVRRIIHLASKDMRETQDYHQGRKTRTHRALILAYCRIAVHAPQMQLLPRVDITRWVLQYYMTGCQVLGISIINKEIQDPDLKLTLIWSVTEISRAIQDADDSQSFQFTCKEELLGYMLNFMKEETMDSLASPVCLRAMLAIKHLRQGETLTESG